MTTQATPSASQIIDFHYECQPTIKEIVSLEKQAEKLAKRTEIILKPIVQKYSQLPIFQGQTIASSDDIYDIAYELEREDIVLAFATECHHKYIKHGLLDESIEVGYCPVLMIEEKIRQLKNSIEEKFLSLNQVQGGFVPIKTLNELVDLLKKRIV